MKHNITYVDRIRIEALYKNKCKPSEIARQTGFHRSTIYNELKRGMYGHYDYEYRYVWSYSADIAERKHKEAQTAKGRPIKLGHDYAFARYIEDCICLEKMSPDVIIGRIHQQGLYFDTQICTRTLYNWIAAGVFLNISNKSLLQQGKRKHKKEQEKRERKTNLAAPKIQERPEIANRRTQSGHWEMDTILSGKGGSAALLVFTDMTSRVEIIRKIPDKTQQSVNRAAANICRKYGKHTFKTITCDNGSEFNYERLSKIFGATIYFCDPYSAWQRGSNENQNSIIRRFIPKGANIDKVSTKYIQWVEAWINNYPRKILGYKTSAEVYAELMQQK